MSPDQPSLILALISLACASVPAALVALNLRRYRPAPLPPSGENSSAVSVLIPARDEADKIAATLHAALANRGIEFEVVVLDDDSKDDTARIVAEIAERDSRVRLVAAPPLPPGWSGKQHACWRLATLARHPLLLFLDADVRLSPDALVRSAAFLDSSAADLASGIPRQEAVGFLERMVIPLIHFVLLGFLPINRMRRTTHSSYSAGCGQFFLTRKAAYFRAGGHAAIRETFHDGIRLPRAYRLAGLKTDLFDPTDLAVCRMYRTAPSLWSGLTKNAVEGLGSPRLIGPMTAILLTGQVLPVILLLVAIGSALGRGGSVLIWPSLFAVAASYAPRLAMIGRFHQSWLSAALHPLGILILLAIQWDALLRWIVGKRATWKGRPSPLASAQVQDNIPVGLHPDDDPLHESERTLENPARR